MGMAVHKAGAFSAAEGLEGVFQVFLKPYGNKSDNCIKNVEKSLLLYKDQEPKRSLRES